MISFILNIPWTLAAVICSLVSLPYKLEINKKPFAFILFVKSFWWYSWLPGMKGVRAMALGQTVLLGPDADSKDRIHELIHVEQSIREPFVHPFLYRIESLKTGYRNNKYEVEAYTKSGSRYIE